MQVCNFFIGRLPLREVLAPAIALARNGAPISPVAADLWAASAHQLLDRWGGLGGNPGAAALLVDGRPPSAGDVLRNGALADTFEALAAGGKGAFYAGRIAEAVVACVQAKGGLLALGDLAAHESTFEAPLSATYRGATVWELPPNGSGLVALLALAALDACPASTGAAVDVHRQVEALRIAFSEGLAAVGDSDGAREAAAAMLAPAASAARRSRIDDARAAPRGGGAASAVAAAGTDTVYLCAVDGDGNACSFICSNYQSFGSGLAPAGCGFTLHNRGANFVLDPGHPNCLAPGKRPYHTIIPGMATDGGGEFLAAFGVMGGFMQPQGQVQVLANLLDRRMDPQAALDAPRFCLSPRSGVEGLQYDGALDDVAVFLEDGFDERVADALEAKGHAVVRNVASFDRKLFGRGQIIVADRKPRRRKRGRDDDAGDAAGGDDVVYWAGSDGRGDGLAIGY